jgi:uncharacterized protein
MLENNKMLRNEAKLKPITGIDLDITNNCILACDYCFKLEKDQSKLSWDIGIKAINWLIEESQGEKKLFIRFLGGEPLLEFKLIKKLVSYAKQKAVYYGKKFYFRVTTNCVLIDDEMIQFFYQHKMKLFTSIDGGPESQDKHRYFPNGGGTSAIIEPKIRKMLKYLPNTIACMTISNDTVHNWFDDILYLLELGYTNFSIDIRPESDWTEEQWGYIQREMRKISDFYIEMFNNQNPISLQHIDKALFGIVHPLARRHLCQAAQSAVFVKTDGRIYPCSRFGPITDENVDDQWLLGSVTDGIDEQKHKTFLSLARTFKINTDCENCIAVNACSTCLAVNLVHFHNICTPHQNRCKFNNMYFAEAMRIHYILKSEKNLLFMKKFYPSLLV